MNLATGNNKISKAIRDIQDILSANDIIAGDGIRILKSDKGITIEADNTSGHPFDYVGTYDENREYFKDDITRVTSSFQVTRDGVTKTVSVGTYIAITDIPGVNQMDSSTTRKAEWFYCPLSDEPTKTEEELYEEEDTTTQPRFWESVGGGQGLNYSLYDYSASYAKDAIVYVSGSQPTKYWSGSNFDSPDKSAWLYDGHYICNQAVSSFASRPSGSFQMPCYPEPSGSERYWNMISLTPKEFVVCNIEENSKTYFLHGTEKEPATSGSVQVL